MAVLDLERIDVDPPTQLPVSHLSVSSLNLFARCPTAWKRRYIDKITDRPNGRMLIGGAAGAALAQHFGRIIDGQAGMTTEELLDEYADALGIRTEQEDVDYGADAPGPLKDRGAGALAHYHRHIAPNVHPLSIEREFELSWPGAPFTLTGFLDLEEEDGAVGDFKMTDKTWGEAKCAAELQPTIYLAARRAEGYPAPEFRYHLMIHTKTRSNAAIVPTARSDRTLELLTGRVFSIARAMEWRWLNDIWDGTPPGDAWMCNRCGHAPTCAWRRG